MSQVNAAVSQVERRDLHRLLTAVAVVGAMLAVAVYQLRQEAARVSAAAPASLVAPGAPAR
jgi:mannose/fructose/N-acetylgalactosamine-specific phosphotransferase system component IIC